MEVVGLGRPSRLAESLLRSNAPVARTRATPLLRAPRKPKRLGFWPRGLGFGRPVVVVACINREQHGELGCVSTTSLSLYSSHCVCLASLCARADAKRGGNHAWHVAG
jgi:hypothetical protein